MCSSYIIRLRECDMQGTGERVEKIENSSLVKQRAEVQLLLSTEVFVFFYLFTMDMNAI